MILLILASSFAQIDLGDPFIPGTGKTFIIRSPILNDHSFNPASFSEKIYTQFTGRLAFSSTRQFSQNISSICLSIPILGRLNMGMGVDLLYNQNFSYTFPQDTNEWDTYTQNITRIGNTMRYSGFVSFRSGDLRFGVMFGYIMGNSEERWTVDFTRYRDIHDTTFTQYKGLTYSGGLVYTFGRTEIGLMGARIYVEGEFTHYKLLTGLSHKFGDTEILISFMNLSPQIGLESNGFALGAGYTVWDKENILEKHMGFSFTHIIRDNPFTFFFLIRQLRDTGTGYELNDTEYTAGISIEFN